MTQNCERGWTLQDRTWEPLSPESYLEGQRDLVSGLVFRVQGLGSGGLSK